MTAQEPQEQLFEFWVYDIEKFLREKNLIPEKILFFAGRGKSAAINSALYAAQLNNGNACVGMTGCVIYPRGMNGNICWVLKLESAIPIVSIENLREKLKEYVKFKN